MSAYIRRFRGFLKRNETAKGLFLVGIVLLGALGVWGAIRLALGTEYPILVVSSGSMCPPTNCVLPIGSLIVVRGQDPATIQAGSPPVGSIIVFRPYQSNPDYLVVHRVIQVYQASQSTYREITFWTRGDANGVNDGWDIPGGGIPASRVVGVYQYTIPIPYLGSAILGIRGFMYDEATGQPRPQGIAVIVALIVALFAFEVIEPSKKKAPTPPSPPSPAVQPASQER